MDMHAQNMYGHEKLYNTTDKVALKSIGNHGTLTDFYIRVMIVMNIEHAVALLSTLHMKMCTTAYTMWIPT